MEDVGSTQSTPEWLQAAQNKWANRGSSRPPFALEPAPGQESVWDYPRPPILVGDTREIVVVDPTSSIELARTTNALRLLETASPPTFYIPPADVDHASMTPAPGSSFCEWKGPASYFSVPHNPDLPVAWSYAEPFDTFAGLAGWISFYPGRVHCTVDGEAVLAQAGGFYGGWVTSEVIGPFKGEPGTSGW